MDEEDMADASKTDTTETRRPLLSRTDVLLGRHNCGNGLNSNTQPGISPVSARCGALGPDGTRAVGAGLLVSGRQSSCAVRARSAPVPNDDGWRGYRRAARRHGPRGV